jgi:hypothetical protein
MNSGSEPSRNPPPPAMPALAWSLLALSAIVTVLWFLAALHYWEDDAYIHLEFARSLASGNGFSFNGHLVYGDTSPLWVWLLVAFHAVVPDWLSVGKTLTACAAVFTLSGVFFYARSLVLHAARRAFHPPQANTFAAAMVLAFILTPYFGYWAFSGMEALAAAGLAAWCCYLIAPHHLNWKRFLLAAFLGGLAPLLRPEMAFFTALFALILFYRVRNMRVSLTLRVDLFVAGILLLTTPAIAWAIYALHVFGRVLPNTNAAKRAAPADSVINRLWHLYGFGYPITVFACFLLIAWFLWYAAKRTHTNPLRGTLHPGGWLLFLWTAVNCLFYVADHTFVQTRYIFVTAPLLTIAAFALMALRWPNIYRNLLTVALLYGAAVSLTTTRLLVRNKVQGDNVYAQLAAYMRTLPPDAPVALYAIGEPAYLSQHPIIDTGGITRPGVVPYIFDTTGDRITDWIYTQGARYEVIDHQPIQGAELVWSRDLPVTGWFFRSHRYNATERLQLWKLPAWKPRL